MDSLLGEKLISVKDAVALTGYGPDHLTRLCRTGKVLGTRVGRSWLIDRASLVACLEGNKERRERQLKEVSKQFAREYENTAPVKTTPVVTPITTPTVLQTEVRTTATPSPYFRKSLVGALTLLVITGGAFGMSGVVNRSGTTDMLASAGTATETSFFGVVKNFGEDSARFTYEAVNTLFGSTGNFFVSLFAPTAVVVEKVIETPAPPVSHATTTVLVRETVIEQQGSPVVNEYYTVTSSGVSREYVEERIRLHIENLDDRIDNRLDNVGGGGGSSGSGNGTVTSVEASGGTTGLSFVGGPIISSGTLTLSGTLAIANGGTGITTAPSYGQLLLGNSLGGYDLVATSSLGISGSGPAGWGSITGTLSSQTDLQNALDAKFSLSDWYATTTDGLDEGLTNRYFSDTLARQAISESITGIDYDNGTGVFSTTAGYAIPLSASTTNWNTFYDTPSSRVSVANNLAWSGNTLGVASDYTIPLLASTTEWDTAYSWSNHATAGYENALSFSYPLTRSVNTIALAFGTTTANSWNAHNIFSSLFATNASTTNATTSSFGLNSETFTDLTGAGLQNIAGVLSLNATGDWTGTFDGQEGSWYLDRANHTGTQLASTISDFNTAVNAYIHASSTIPKTYTANTFTGAQTFNGGVTIGSLSGVLYGVSGVTNAVATSTPTLGLGLSYSGTLGSFVGGSSGSLTVATSSLFTGTTGQVSYFSGTNQPVGTSSLFIATSGNVGVGDTAPSAKLSIANGASDPTNYGRALQITNASGNRQQVAYIRNGFNIVASGYNGATNVWGYGAGQATDANFTPNYLAFDLAGSNIGIGTTSPVEKLSILSGDNLSATNIFAVRANNLTQGIGIGYNTIRGLGTNQGLTLDTPGTGDLTLATGGGSRLTVDGATGYIGLGTTTPGYSAQVAGSESTDANNTRTNALFAITEASAETHGLYFRLRGNSAGIGGGTYENQIFGYGGSGTALYSNTGYLSLGTNSTSRLYIDGTGNVGIGTTTPNSKLQVIGGNVEIGPSYGSGTAYDTGNRTLQIGAYSGTPTLSLQRHNTEQFNIFVNSSGHTEFGNAGGTRMTFQSTTGNVGIGTTTPGEKLAVFGGDFSIQYGQSIRARDNSDGSWLSGTTKLIETGWTGATDFVSYYTPGSVRSTPVMTMLANGNVGIGTTSPEVGLSINASDSFGLLHLTDSSSNGTASISFRSADDANGGAGHWLLGKNLGGLTSDQFSIWQGTAGNRLTINTSGNVGIGTTTPYGKLHIVESSFPSIYLGSSGAGTDVKHWRTILDGSSNFLIQAMSDDNSTGNTAMQFTRSGANTSQVLFPNGNVGIGVSPTAKLDVAGATYFRGAAAAGALLAILPDATSGANGITLDTSFVTGGYGPLIIKTNNAEALRVTASGNVGIGTTSPYAKLSVVGPVVAEYFHGTSTSASTFGGSINVGGTGQQYVGFSSGANALALNASSGTGLTSTASIFMNIDSNNDETTRYFAVGHNSNTLGSATELFRVQEDGRVGIGISSPRTRLQVLATTSVAQMTLGNPTGVGLTVSAAGDSSYGLNFGTHGDGTAWIQNGRLDGTATAYNMSLQASGGNVGIGTISPSYLLDVNGIISARSYIVNDANAYRFTDDTGNSWVQATGGAFGIGTASPGNTLTIEGSSPVAEIRSGGYLMMRPTANDWDMRLQATSGNKLNVFSGGDLSYPIATFVHGGNVGIGTSTPAVRLDLGQAGGWIRGSGLYIEDHDGTTGKLARLYNYAEHFGISREAANVGGYEATLFDIALSDGTAYFVGNLGLGGDTAPAAKLSISNGATDGTNYGRGIQITNASGNSQQMAFIRNGFNVISAGYDGASSRWGFGPGQSTDANFDPSYISVDLGTGGVGIGTTTPAQLLSIGNLTGSNAASSFYNLGVPTMAVKDSLYSYGYICSNNGSGACTGAGGVVIGPANTSAGINLNHSTGNSFINNGGHFGVGGTNPQARLHVFGTAASQGMIVSNTDFVTSSAGSGMFLGQGATSGNTYSVINALHTGATQWSNLVLQAGGLNGLVGIGTTNPSAKLDVTSNIRVSGTSASALRFEHYVSDGATDQKLWWNYAQDGTMVFQTVNDAVSAGTIWLQVNRSGHSVSSVSFPSGTVSAGALSVAGLLTQSSSGIMVATKDNISTRTESGFYQTSSGTSAEGWPLNSGDWQHLISSTHSNGANYYSLQIGGGFYDQSLYFRKTADNGVQAWTKIIGQTDIDTSSELATIVTDETGSGALVFGTSPNFTTSISGNGKTIFDTGDTYLRINEAQNFSAGIWRGNSNFLGGTGYITAGSNGGTTDSRVYITSDAYNGTNVIRIDGTAGATSYFNAGSVGIGVTSPQARLNVLSSSNIAVADLMFTYDASGNYRSGISNIFDGSTVANNKMSFLVSNASATTQATVMTLVGNGNVGIGTTAPGSALTVVGDISVSGTIGIGGASAGLYGIHIAGAIAPNTDAAYDLGGATRTWNCVYANGDSMGSCISDERLKENIESASFDGALDKISKLQIRSFNYIGGEVPQKGFIAQEVLEVVPEMVFQNDEGYYGVRYGDVQWITLEALQELALNVDSLTGTTTLEELEEGSFAKRFFDGLFTRLVAWFESAENGIGTLFAGEVRTGTLCVKNSEGEDVCISGDELQLLMAGASSAHAEDGDDEEEEVTETPEEGAGEETPNEDSEESGETEEQTDTEEEITEDETPEEEAVAEEEDTEEEAAEEPEEGDSGEEEAPESGV